MSINNPKSKAVSLFLILLVVILGSTLTYLSTIPKNSENNVSKVTKLETSESEGIKEDPIKDWKTYTNEKYGFSFRYPKDWFVLKESDGSVELGFTPVANDVSITYLIISTSSATKLESISVCGDIVNNRPCIWNDGWGQSQPISNIKFSGYQAVSAYLSYGVDANYRIVQIKNNPNIELKMNVSGGGLDSVFDQILSTFEFANATAKVSGQTDLIVPRPKSDAQEVSTKATKYTFSYTPSFVKSVNPITDPYYNVDFTLSSGANLSISIPFMGEATVFDTKPTLKIIDNSNFKNKINRIKDNYSENTYRYITGYSEDMNDCGFVDNSHFACGDGDSLLGEGTFSISCVASSAASLKGCDDFMKNLNISVSVIDL